MGRVIDEADFQQRLRALDSSNYGRGEELRLVITGKLDARKTMDLAKQRALEKARKKLAQAILKAEEKMRAQGLVPTEVEEIVTGRSDELVKV
jgi:hypothetical protein